MPKKKTAAKPDLLKKTASSKQTLKNSSRKKAPKTILAKSNLPQEHLHYHKDGSLWAQGQMQNDVMVGFWVWFRKDGTRLRSGSFENGEQTGEWTTYDKVGNVYKVTVMKPKRK